MKKNHLIIFLVATAIVSVAAAFLWAYYRQSAGEVVRVEIKDNRREAIAAALSEAKVLDLWSALVFRFAASARGADKDFHSGVFLLKKGEGARGLIAILRTRGRSEVTVTIPEGSDLRDLAVIFKKAGLVRDESDFFAVTGEPAKRGLIPAITASDYPFLADKPPDISLDGYLFPDTYRFFADAEPKELVKKMLDNFESRTREIRSSMDGKMSAHEYLTIASILEAEVPKSDDRKKVADIVLRRLKSGMPLQVDSSVNYASGKSGLYTSAEDRARDSGWNTYKNRDLPLGPINNPGISSLYAALSPEPNDFWFFLTAPDGKVYYARTLEEHIANKKYLK